MDRLYVFLIRNDVWIYILCALGLLWFSSEFLRSQGALRRAAFRLERETALLTRNRALFFMVLLGSIAATVAYVNIEVRPNLPPGLLRPPTPTPEPGSGPQPTPTEEAEVTEIAPSPTSPLPPTVTLSEAEGGVPITGTETLTTTAPLEGTIEPPDEEEEQEDEQPPPGPLASCSEDANITEPRAGATIRTTLNVFGTANTEDFAFYELEIRGPQTNDRWASLLGRTVETPVEEGILGGNLNLTEWAPGPYQLRLTITNNSGDITNQCSVDVRLDN